MNLSRQGRGLSLGDLDDLFAEPSVQLHGKDPILDRLDCGLERASLRLHGNQPRLHPPRELGMFTLDLLEECGERLVLGFHE